MPVIVENGNALPCVCPRESSATEYGFTSPLVIVRCSRCFDYTASSREDARRDRKTHVSSQWNRSRSHIFDMSSARRMCENLFDECGYCFRFALRFDF